MDIPIKRVKEFFEIIVEIRLKVLEKDGFKALSEHMLKRKEVDGFKGIKAVTI